jgi:hypothetical protein
VPRRGPRPGWNEAPRREICPKWPDKLVFYDIATACVEAIAKSLEFDVPQVPYVCEACGHYHLTTHRERIGQLLVRTHHPEGDLKVAGQPWQSITPGYFRPPRDPRDERYLPRDDDGRRRSIG